MNNLLLLFIVLNIVNVALQTAKSLVTVKGSPVSASLINAITYFVYSYVLIFMSIDGLTTLAKASVVAGSNLIGVYVVKSLEKKMKRDRLWKVELSTKTQFKDNITNLLKESDISFMSQDYDNHYTLFTTFCKTQKDTQKVVDIGKVYNTKFFATECKSLAL